MQLKSYQMNKWETLEIYNYVKGKKKHAVCFQFQEITG